jgi:putative transposase
MNLVKKIKLIITKTDKEKFDFWLRKCNYLYNVALQEKIWYYQATGKYLNKFEQKKELVDIKNYDTSWKDVPNKSLSEIIFRVDKSFNNFFRGEGFPKFKGKDNFNSIEFVETDVRVKNNLVYLPKLKKGFKGTELFPTKYKTVKLIRENNSYYLTFICDYEIGVKENKNTNVIGCDLGLKTLLTDSNGVKIKRFSVNLINSYNNRINKLNISLSKKKKGSKNRNKTKKQLNKAYTKLKNSCNDYLHKESIKYIKNLNEDILVIGKLEVSNLIKKDGSKKQNNISKSYTKSSITTFVNLLNYKATKYGKEVKIVDEEYTSKTCSCCGRVKYELKVTDREYNCTYCELNIDRDINGAINIRKIYFDEFKPIGVNLTKLKNCSVRAI